MNDMCKMAALTLIQFQHLKEPLGAGHSNVTFLLVPCNAVQLHIVRNGNL